MNNFRNEQDQEQYDQYMGEDHAVTEALWFAVHVCAVCLIILYVWSLFHPIAAVVK